jgi:predicted ATPase
MLLWSFYTVRADYGTARALADQCMRLAERMATPAVLMWANLAVGQTLLFTGNLLGARPHLERAYALYDPEQHRARRSRATQDPGVMALACLAHLLVLLGYPDQAIEHARAAQALALRTAHPHSVAYALTGVAQVHGFRRDHAGVRAAAEDLWALAREQQFVYYEAVAIKQRGLARALAGEFSDAVALLQQGIEAARGTQGQLLVGYYLGHLASAFGHIGALDDAWRSWSETATRAEHTGEGYYLPLLSQLKGDLLVLAPHADVEEAERCYREALTLADRQGAKLYELTAATRLARLWQRQGRIAEARDLLATVYAWFTEGLDTHDLRDASALLTDLNQARTVAV